MKFKKLYTQNSEELKNTKEFFQSKYSKLQKLKLNLDLTRGKPSLEQLNLSNDLIQKPVNFNTVSGIDVRNYSTNEGIYEIRKIFSDLYNVEFESLLAANNSSMQLMSNTLNYLMLFGASLENGKPWCKQEKIKFLCPVPGYDRHFELLEHLNIELLPVPLTDDGVDIKIVEKLVSNDKSIKGMFIVPIFSNPTGTVYSENNLIKLFSMQTAAEDFRILIDNAYAVHPIFGNFPTIPNFLKMAFESGNPDRVLVFFSTSKISYAGSGVAFLAANKNNFDWFNYHYYFEIITPDKVNQLEHANFFKNSEGVKNLMRKHQNILKPKFELALNILDKNLSDLDFVYWTKPKGGYFIAVEVADNTAKRVVELCKNAGLQITPAGFTYPYKQDPNDCWLRLAPSFATLLDLENAFQIFTTSIVLAALEKL